jgi:hypothetical protein
LVARTVGEPDGLLILDGSEVPKRGVHSAGWRRSGAGRAARPTIAKRACTLATPAERATRCWSGASTCPRRGLTPSMRRCGRAVAVPPTSSSKPERSWAQRCSSRCTRVGTCPPRGWSATNGLDAIRRYWIASTPPDGGIWRQSPAPRRSGRCASRGRSAGWTAGPLASAGLAPTPRGRGQRTHRDA